MSATSTTESKQRLKGIGLVFLGSIFFSTKAIIVKLMYRQGVDPLSALTLRMLFALPFFLLIAFWSFRQKDRPQLSRQDWWQVIGLGVLGYYLASLFDFLGLQYISAGLERLILFVYPTIVVLLVAFFEKKPISRAQLFALVLTYLGIVVAFLGEVKLGDGQHTFWGVVLVFLCGFCFAGFIYGSGKIIPRLGTIRFTALAMCFSCLAILTHYLIFHPVSLWGYDASIYQYALLMALIATVIPVFCFSESIRLIGSGDMAIVASVGPISTLVLAFLFLGDPISGWQILGLGCILLGVWRIKKQ